MDPRSTKYTLIKRRLKTIDTEQHAHYKQSVRTGRIHMLTKAAIHALNAVSLTALAMTFAGAYMTLIVCAASNGMATVGGAVLEVLNLHERQLSHYQSHTQLVDLHNDIWADLLHEDVTNADLDRILSDLNQRSALIGGNAQPIHMRSKTMSIKSPHQPTRVCHGRESESILRDPRERLGSREPPNPARGDRGIDGLSVVVPQSNTPAPTVASTSATSPG